MLSARSCHGGLMSWKLSRSWLCSVSPQETWKPCHRAVSCDCIPLTVELWTPLGSYPSMQGCAKAAKSAIGEITASAYLDHCISPCSWNYFYLRVKVYVLSQCLQRLLLGFTIAFSIVIVFFNTCYLYYVLVCLYT